MVLPIALYLDANPVERWIPLYDPDDFDGGPVGYDPDLAADVPERFHAAVAEIVVVEHDIDCVASPVDRPCLLGSLLDGDDDSQVRWWPALVVVDPAGRITYRCEGHAFDAETDGRCVSCTMHHHQGCDGETLDVGPCGCACRPGQQ